MPSSKILLGISASIAAYKSIVLLRLLKKKQYDVRVVMTPQSEQFVSPLVLQTLSSHSVGIHLQNENEWANHVALGRWADLFVVAPLTCNSLAKMAFGLCDNLLLACYLSAKCPVLVAPAMDEDMWLHPSVQSNIATLQQRKVRVLDVAYGELGSGLVGSGRMQEPETILSHIETILCTPH